MKGDNANFYILPVLSTFDPDGGGRIRVRIPAYDDDNAPIESLPYVFPMLPKHLHVNPKVGESVIVFLQQKGKSGTQRVFVGPIISQPYTMDYDLHNGTARSLLTGTQTGLPEQSPEKDEENLGTLPEREDIAIEGRKNADIVLKDNEVRIRCGHKKDAGAREKLKRLKRNTVDPAYIQMKYAQRGTRDDLYSSSINIVADRINLLSHDSKTLLNLNGDRKDGCINDDEMANIETKAHPMIYGDELVDFLRNVVTALVTHTHPFPMKSTVMDNEMARKLMVNLDDMLSKSIKFN